MPFRKRRQERIERILEAVDKLNPEWATVSRIARVADLSAYTGMKLISQLEASGELTSRWVEGDRPRRRVYARKGGGHRYLSTGCLHGEHGYCKSSTGAAGAKIPGQCKFCAAPCICECHREEAPTRGDQS